MSRRCLDNLGRPADSADAVCDFGFCDARQTPHLSAGSITTNSHGIRSSFDQKLEQLPGISYGILGVVQLGVTLDSGVVLGARGILVWDLLLDIEGKEYRTPRENGSGMRGKVVLSERWLSTGNAPQTV